MDLPPEVDRGVGHGPEYSTVVLAGQAREQAIEFASDPVAAILAADPVRVVFAHDLAVWETRPA